MGASAISGIKGASIGGGGRMSAPSGGGSAPSAPAPQAPAQQVNRSIDVNFTGQGVMSMDAVRELIEQFNEALGDGASLNITGG